MREKPLLLVADDDNDFREVVSVKLKGAGFDVSAAKDGDEALKKAKEILPDLAVLDIRMPPGPTGVEVALQLKAAPETKDIKILFLSGLDDPWPAFTGDKSEVSKELGVEDFFPKTNDLDELVKKVRELIAKGMPVPKQTDA